MHITLCCLSDNPVPPPAYGGTQRVVYWLGKALLALGHQVTLIAHPKSNVPGAELRGLRDFSSNATAWEELVPASTDILHLNATPVKPPTRPCVVTIGGNGRPGETFHANSIFVSRSHAVHHQTSHYVYNGIDPEEYECSPERDEYAVFLAKSSWAVKNLRGAIEVCR